MNIALDEPLHLLHTARFGTLATRSRDDGCPYPTVLPFAPDARHRPVMLVSRLAEHTRNLQADAHAGFLVFDADVADVLTGARTTLTGRAVPSECAGGGAGSPARRYLRYHPEAERYLQLGDFSFFTLVPAKLRHIGGFGAMGWLDAHELNPVAPLDDAEETAWIDTIAHTLPAGIHVLGIDRLGVDYECAGARRRQTFARPNPEVSANDVSSATSLKIELEAAIAAIKANSPAVR